MAFEPEKMRAAFFTKHGFVVRTLTIPHPGPDEVAIAVDACGICGSDLHFFSGDAPAPEVCPGHEISGRVLAGGAGVHPGLAVVVEPLIGCGACRACAGGDPNLCPSLQLIGRERPGGFAEILVVPTCVVHPVPDNVDLAVAMLAEPLAVALHAMRKVTIGKGSEVLVLGGGTIGLLLTFLAARSGAHVTMSARHPQQREAALLMGATLVAMAGTELPTAGHYQPDVVFETVGGRARTLQRAIDYVRPGGAIVALGVFSRPPTIDPIVCLAKEVRMVWSTMYNRTDPSDFAAALAILRDEQVRLKRLITHSVSLEEIQRGFALASDKRSGAIKVAVRPGQKL